jgi:hypothetical protein
MEFGICLSTSEIGGMICILGWYLALENYLELNVLKVINLIIFWDPYFPLLILKLLCCLNWILEFIFTTLIFLIRIKLDWLVTLNKTLHFIIASTINPVIILLFAGFSLLIIWIGIVSYVIRIIQIRVIEFTIPTL